MRRPVIAGNWKMYKTVFDGVRFISQLKDLVSNVTDVQIIVAPPFLSIYPVVQEVKDSNILVSAQDVFWKEEGAYTGEISPKMLLDAGCNYVIIGHSERRKYFQETDETVNKKITASLRQGIIPIFCVGESIRQRESGETLHIIESQIKRGLLGLSSSDLKDVIIAYEPIWAIGTGKTATSKQAEEVHVFIRGILREIFEGIADSARILYGGSVKPSNIDELMAEPNIDGALVGGASLKVEDFTRIVRFKWKYD